MRKQYKRYKRGDFGVNNVTKKKTPLSVFVNFQTKICQYY